MISTLVPGDQTKSSPVAVKTSAVSDPAKFNPRGFPISRSCSPVARLLFPALSSRAAQVRRLGAAEVDDVGPTGNRRRDRVDRLEAQDAVPDDGLDTAGIFGDVQPQLRVERDRL